MPPESKPKFAYAAAIAHALSHPLRIQILETLEDEGTYVMNLTERLERPQANISQHLAVLREVGLVKTERDGMTVRYHLKSPVVHELIATLHTLAGQIPADSFIPRGRVPTLSAPSSAQGFSQNRRRTL
ncbi:MAG: hypothetical protein B6243_05040 [Anaerolineaceae bacterium 4572_5.2]|nr:MAG: hypothetical protein B6243_05040 [Anaerolineaceae bacterium 4572_5.2]